MRDTGKAIIIRIIIRLIAGHAQYTEESNEMLRIISHHLRQHVKARSPPGQYIYIKKNLLSPAGKEHKKKKTPKIGPRF